MQPSSLPLSKRPMDIILIIFFAINLFFITYIVDLEQLVISNADHFQYPFWPPSKMVDLVHWYGRNFDPVLMARPAWWRATIWIYAFAVNMIEQKRGAIVLMSSIAGFQGSGYLSAYAASKAFGRILAESLWYEWKSKGVDVIACCAGATATPNYYNSNPKKTGFPAPRPQTSEQVVEACLKRIGKTPSFISGNENKIASFLMQHIFSRRMAINLMGDNMRKIYGITD
jgi:NAD(P)-dependent dehydrogenase (short-subunit alcohol dehydrogenase family)